ncbi:lactoylglutathione lyase [Aliidiomarina sedimenti]|uniref:Lactoylglutathione lyase n=1 Tax=Aliidiomarina sedimenti TaxID=1933879 RepID=A0ABY0BXN8_9GAMM|nr:lactoylglutathione lyase [Aliidiomarina sedimenti]RUO29187.1 lactoylglutathione lyase [Aliidiomarina sedimenti]
MSRHFETAPGLCEARDSETNDYVFNQTMLRIKDPERTLDFYSRVLGMTLVKKLPFPEMKFTLYFLAAIPQDELSNWSSDDATRLEQTFGRPAMLELTYNWGDKENDEVAYHNGNSEPKGFGHIGFAVPDLSQACARFDALGVTYVKRPEDGKMNNLAFIQDPDGYWIEIFAPHGMQDGLDDHLGRDEGEA